MQQKFTNRISQDASPRYFRISDVPPWPSPKDLGAVEPGEHEFQAENIQDSKTHPREIEKPATFLCQLILPPVHSYGKTWYDVWYDLPFSGTVYELILTDKSWNTASPQIFCLDVLDLDPVSQRPLKYTKRKLPRNGSVWITTKIIVFLERPFIE